MTNIIPFTRKELEDLPEAGPYNHQEFLDSGIAFKGASKSGFWVVYNVEGLGMASLPSGWHWEPCKGPDEYFLQSKLEAFLK